MAPAVVVVVTMCTLLWLLKKDIARRAVRSRPAMGREGGKYAPLSVQFVFQRCVCVKVFRSLN